MKPPNEQDEINLIWASDRKMALAQCLNMRVEESTTPSEDSMEVITTTRQTFASKHSNPLQPSPNKKTRNRKSKCRSKLRRRARRADYLRSPCMFYFRGLNRNALQRHMSNVGKFTKVTASECSLQRLVPSRSVSQILMTEETICMGASSQDEESQRRVRRSSYRRVSALEICETTTTTTDSDCDHHCKSAPTAKASSKEEEEEQQGEEEEEQEEEEQEGVIRSRAYQRLLKPRKKSVRLQTLPEPDPTPPPSPTESEKEADFLRRSELFKRSRAYQRLMAPRKINKASNTDNKLCLPKVPETPTIVDEPFLVSDKTPLIPEKNPQAKSRMYKMASFRREHLTDCFVSAKTLALVERAATSAKKRKKNVQTRTMPRKPKVFERLTLPRSTPAFPPTAARHGTSAIDPPQPLPSRDPAVDATALVKALTCRSPKVFKRLTALKKRREDPSWDNLCLLDTNGGSSETNLSLEEEKFLRERDFCSSPIFRRLTAVRKRSDRWSFEDSIKSHQEDKRSLQEKMSEGALALDEEYRKQLSEKHSAVLERLLAPRRASKGSDWSREASSKASFALHKFRSLLNKSLFEYAVSIPPKKEEDEEEAAEADEEKEREEGDRESSAFRRLLAPRLRARARRVRDSLADRFWRCGGASSSSTEKLIPTPTTPDDWHPPLPFSKDDRMGATPSERGERFTDTSYETISVASDGSALSNESEADGDGVLPVRSEPHPSWQARAECCDILREISALRRKMAKQICKMTSEIYENPARRGQHDLWSKRNHVANTWNPLRPFRSLDEWRLRAPRSKGQPLSTGPYHIK